VIKRHVLSSPLPKLCHSTEVLPRLTTRATSRRISARPLSRSEQRGSRASRIRIQPALTHSFPPAVGKLSGILVLSLAKQCAAFPGAWYRADSGHRSRPRADTGQREAKRQPGSPPQEPLRFPLPRAAEV